MNSVVSMFVYGQVVKIGITPQFCIESPILYSMIWNFVFIVINTLIE